MRLGWVWVDSSSGSEWAQRTGVETSHQVMKTTTRRRLRGFIVSYRSGLGCRFAVYCCLRSTQGRTTAYKKNGETAQVTLLLTLKVSEAEAKAAKAAKGRP